MYSFDNYTREEVDNFYSSLSVITQDKMTQFIMDGATLVYNYDIACECGYKTTGEFTEFSTFFI